MLAQIKRSVSLYILLSIIVGAQGAVLIFVHNFGNHNVDVVAGSVLAGLAVVSIVGHGFLATLVIPVPGNVFSALQVVNGGLVTLLAGSGMVIQYVGTVSPTLTPWCALILQGLALLGSLLAQLLKVTTSATLARRAVAR